jgi:FkbM family methyltransferase
VAAEAFEVDAAPAVRPGVVAELLKEVIRDAHRYAPGIEQSRATVAGPTPRRRRVAARERLRDLVERTAGRAGFSHRHFSPEVAGTRLQRLLELSDGLDATYAMLGDEDSRRALLDVLKLRILGPYHAPLAVTPEAYRKLQARVEREMRVTRGTFEVSDPWFSPLSLYRVRVNGGPEITLHSHSVDVVSVFVLGQYGYARGSDGVSAGPEDVVLDVGGCWGDTALYFASLVGPRGRVYTFEFDPESLEILRANLALNPELASRIEVVERALWDRSGETLGIVQAGRCTSVRPEDRGGRLRVPTVTLDDFVREADLDRLDLVKMDVEGAELRVLRGARGSLACHGPKLAIAAYHHDDDLVTIPEQLAGTGAGYRLYLDTFSPVEEETVLFASATSRNSST